MSVGAIGMLVGFSAKMTRNLARGTGGSNPSPSAGESVLTGAFHGYRRKGPALAGSVSLDETRERDVPAPSQLALSRFL